MFKCFCCGQPGHKADACENRESEEAVEYRANRVSSSQIACYVCVAKVAYDSGKGLSRCRECTLSIP